MRPKRSEAMIRALLAKSPDGVTATEAAKLCRVTRQQSNRVLKALHEMGLVVVIGVTPEGGGWIYASTEFHSPDEDSREVVWNAREA